MSLIRENTGRLSFGVFCYSSVNTTYIQLFRALSLHLQSGNTLLNQPLADVAAPSYKYKFKYEALKILSSHTVKNEEEGGERRWWIKKWRRKK
jgi:hypothetical protein